jgi:hypothetical protein
MSLKSCGLVWADRKMLYTEDTERRETTEQRDFSHSFEMTGGSEGCPTSDTDPPHHQNLEGREPAIVRLSFRVAHEKDAEYDHQKGP